MRPRAPRAGRTRWRTPTPRAAARPASAARTALADQGFDGGFDLDISCTPLPRNCLSPGSVITVVVRTRVDLPLAPAALGGGAPSFRVDSTHRVPYGTYVEER